MAEAQKEKPQGSITVIKGVIKADTAALITNGVESFPEDDFAGSYMAAGNNGFTAILEPFYKPLALALVVQQNNVLSQCIDAMEVNIDGTGHTIDLIEGSSENEKEKKMLEDFFKEPYPNKSMIGIRRRIRRDLEISGNGYMEVIRNAEDDVVLLNSMAACDLRLIRLDDPVVVERPVVRNGSEINVSIRTRERRFVQWVNGKKVYFREFNASRQINRETGEWEKEGEKLPLNMRGSEILHFIVNEEAHTPYGAPRWLNQLPSALGSRKAEEFNLSYFDAGGLPPVLVMVQGGILGDQVKEELVKHLSGGGHRAAVVEAISSSGTLESSGTVQMRVERFGADRQSDSMFQKYDEACEEHIRVGFRIPPMFLGKSKDFNFACYSDDTQTLTDHGWINWDEYQEGMKIATVNPQTLALEYHPPFGDRALVYDIQDVVMHHIKTGNVDMLVTPKHRMMFSVGGQRRVEPIEEMLGFRRIDFSNHAQSLKGGKALESFQIPMACTGTYNQSTLGGQSIPGDLFLEFLGYWISEGTSSEAYTQRGVVTVGQKKQDSLKKISECFIKLSEIVKTYSIVQPNGMHYLSLKNFGLKDWLRKHCGGKAFEKRLPQVFRTLPTYQLQILFDALMLGDGTVDSRERRKSMSYSSTSYQLASDMQELATMLGHRASLRKERPGTLGVRPVYRVLMTLDAKDNQIDTLKDIKAVKYTGKVYCFSVPNGVFITRRNGKVALQGNTAHTSYMVAEAQVFGPEREEFDTILNKTILKSLGAKSYYFKSSTLTLSDVEAQLKAMDLVSKVSPTDKEEFLSVLNKIVNLNVEFKPVEQPLLATATVAEGNLAGAAPAGGTPGAPGAKPGATPPQQPPQGDKPPKLIGPPAKQTVTHTVQTVHQPDQAAAPLPKAQPKLKVVKSHAMDIVALANQWSDALGMNGKQSITKQEMDGLKESVAALDPEDFALFNEVLVSKNLSRVTMDQEGLGELCGCTTEHLRSIA